jgi:hypothetical protein
MAAFAVDLLCNDTPSVLTVTGEVDIEHAADLAAVGLLTLTSPRLAMSRFVHRVHR